MTVLETGLFNVAWFMIAVPLVVAALLLVLGRRSDAWGHVLATVCLLYTSPSPRDRG